LRSLGKKLLIVSAMQLLDAETSETSGGSSQAGWMASSSKAVLARLVLF
jgi:hypothetical protein